MKKITVLLLAILAIFALSACGNDSLSQPLYTQGSTTVSTSASAFRSDRVTVYLCTEVTEGDTRTVMEYDEMGNLLCEITYENGVEADRTAYSLAETTAPEADTCDEKERTYDEKGNLLCEVSFDDNGNETSREEYTYNDAGLPVSQWSTVRGTETMRYEYQYNARGKMTRYDQYFRGEHCGHKVFTYNADGNLTETVQYDRDRVYRRLTFQYDSSGQLETVLYENNWGASLSTYRYETFHLPRQQAASLTEDAFYPMVIPAN